MGEVVGYSEVRALRAERWLRLERMMSVTQGWRQRRRQGTGAHPLFRGASASRILARYGAWDEV